MYDFPKIGYVLNEKLYVRTYNTIIEYLLPLAIPWNVCIIYKYVNLRINREYSKDKDIEPPPPPPRRH